jgi:hypothetical protein
MLVDRLWHGGVTFDDLAAEFQVPLKQVVQWAHGRRAPNKRTFERLQVMANSTGASRPSPAVRITLAAMEARERRRLAKRQRLAQRYGPNTRPPRWSSANPAPIGAQKSGSSLRAIYAWSTPPMLQRRSLLQFQRVRAAASTSAPLPNRGGAREK